MYVFVLVFVFFLLLFSYFLLNRCLFIISMLYVCHAGTCLYLNCINVNSVLKINKDIWEKKNNTVAKQSPHPAWNPGLQGTKPASRPQRQRA